MRSSGAFARWSLRIGTEVAQKIVLPSDRPKDGRTSCIDNAVSCSCPALCSLVRTICGDPDASSTSSVSNLAQGKICAKASLSEFP